VVTTFLGAAAAHATFGWPLLAVLVGNWLAVGYAFMINDVEDAPDDALNPAKAQRNPVSAGDLSVPAAQTASYAVALAAALVFSLLGWRAMLFGLASLVLGHLYSWRAIRLKTIPGLDLISHGLMLAGLQFLAAYYTFSTPTSWGWVFPFALIMAVSLYGELFNEMRDLEGDMRAGLQHTATVLGPQMTTRLMSALLVVALVSAVMSLLVSDLMPLWALVLLVLLELLFAIPAVWKARHAQTPGEFQQPFHVPVQTAGALAMTIYFAEPWLSALLHGRLFLWLRPWLDAVVRLQPF
jgi:4-hydroxybenzoate polyprenyltransferase